MLERYPPINWALQIFQLLFHYMFQPWTGSSLGEFTFWTNLNNHTTKQLKLDCSQDEISIHLPFTILNYYYYYYKVAVYLY